MVFLIRTIYLSVLIIFLLGIFAKPALAYVDPGTGSFIFQILIAFGLSAAFAVKMYWKKLKSFFTKKDITDDSE